MSADTPLEGKTYQEQLKLSKTRWGSPERLQESKALFDIILSKGPSSPEALRILATPPPEQPSPTKKRVTPKKQQQQQQKTKTTKQRKQPSQVRAALPPRRSLRIALLHSASSSSIPSRLPLSSVGQLPAPRTPSSPLQDLASPSPFPPLPSVPDDFSYEFLDYMPSSPGAHAAHEAQVHPWAAAVNATAASAAEQQIRWSFGLSSPRVEAEKPQGQRIAAQGAQAEAQAGRMEEGKRLDGQEQIAMDEDVAQGSEGGKSAPPVELAAGHQEEQRGNEVEGIGAPTEAALGEMDDIQTERQADPQALHHSATTAALPPRPRLEDQLTQAWGSFSLSQCEDYDEPLSGWTADQTASSPQLPQGSNAALSSPGQARAPGAPSQEHALALAASQEPVASSGEASSQSIRPPAFYAGMSLPFSFARGSSQGTGSQTRSITADEAHASQSQSGSVAGPSRSAYSPAGRSSPSGSLSPRSRTLLALAQLEPPSSGEAARDPGFTIDLTAPRPMSFSPRRRRQQSADGDDEDDDSETSEAAADAAEAEDGRTRRASAERAKELIKHRARLDRFHRRRIAESQQSVGEASSSTSTGDEAETQHPRPARPSALRTSDHAPRLVQRKLRFQLAEGGGASSSSSARGSERSGRERPAINSTDTSDNEDEESYRPSAAKRRSFATMLPESSDSSSQSLREDGPSAPGPSLAPTAAIQRDHGHDVSATPSHTPSQSVRSDAEGSVAAGSQSTAGSSLVAAKGSLAHLQESFPESESEEEEMLGPRVPLQRLVAAVAPSAPEEKGPAGGAGVEEEVARDEEMDEGGRAALLREADAQESLDTPPLAATTVGPQPPPLVVLESGLSTSEALRRLREERELARQETEWLRAQQAGGQMVVGGVDEEEDTGEEAEESAAAVAIASSSAAINGDRSAPTLRPLGQIVDGLLRYQRGEEEAEMPAQQPSMTRGETSAQAVEQPQATSNGAPRMPAAAGAADPRSRVRAGSKRPRTPSSATPSEREAQRRRLHELMASIVD